MRSRAGIETPGAARLRMLKVNLLSQLPVAGQLATLVVGAVALLWPAPFTQNQLFAAWPDSDVILSHWPTGTPGSFLLAAQLLPRAHPGTPGVYGPGDVAPGAPRGRVTSFARARGGDQLHGDAGAARPPRRGTRDHRSDRCLVSLARAGLLGDGARAAPLGRAAGDLYCAGIAGRPSANGLLWPADDHNTVRLVTREAIATGGLACAALIWLIAGRFKIIATQIKRY